jgi:hypothetical protein
MKKSTLSAFLILLFALSSLAACHGHKSDDQPVKAVITLSTSGALPAGTLIYGARATINLPAGVTAKASPSSADPSQMVTDNGVVVAAGASVGAELVLASYTTSTTTPPTHSIELNVAKSDGFSTGDFVTVNCDIAAGSNPAATDFPVTDFEAVDQNGATITGLTVGMTAAIQ